MLNDQQKQQVRSKFPGVNDDDLDEPDTNALASRIASVTGKDRDEVKRELDDITR
jgi:hypothetical protein